MDDSNNPDDSDKNTILMNFMATTNLTDYGQSYQLLEMSNWNISQAVSLHFGWGSDSMIGDISESINDKTVPRNSQTSNHNTPTNGNTPQIPKFQAQLEQNYQTNNINDDLTTCPNFENNINDYRDPFRLLRSGNTVKSTNKISDINISSTKSKLHLKESKSSIDDSQKIQITITNKHNSKKFTKSYEKTTKIAIVREDACNYFNIPIEYAIWNMPAKIIDSDMVSEFKNLIVNLEMENLAASIERTNDWQQTSGPNNEIVISSESENEVMAISSDDSNEDPDYNTINTLGSDNLPKLENKIIDVDSLFNHNGHDRMELRNKKPLPGLRKRPNDTKSSNSNQNINSNTSTSKSSKSTNTGTSSRNGSDIMQNTGFLPASYDNIPQAINKMIENIRKRFTSSKLPNFIVGSLGDCLSNTVNIRGDNSPWSEINLNNSLLSDKSPTVIYVNDDASLSKNIFLSQVLFKEPFLSLLNSTSIWCWDVTSEENKQRFIGFIDKYFNTNNNNRMENAAMDLENAFNIARSPFLTRRFNHLNTDKIRIEAIDKNDYPILIYITQDEEIKSKPKIQDIVVNYDDRDKIASKLVNCINIQKSINTKNQLQEKDRIEREKFRREQEKEYEKSINKDLENKEELAHQEKIQRAISMEAKETKIKKMNNIKISKLALNANDKLVSKLNNSSQEVVVKLKLPDGQNFSKKFNIKETIEILFHWAITLEYENCLLNSIYPRVKLNEIDKSSTIFSIFGKQAQIVLERTNDEIEEEDDEEDDSETE